MREGYVFYRPDKRRISHPVMRECENCYQEFEPWGKKKDMCAGCDALYGRDR